VFFITFSTEEFIFCHKSTNGTKVGVIVPFSLLPDPRLKPPLYTVCGPQYMSVDALKTIAWSGEGLTVLWTGDAVWTAK